MDKRIIVCKNGVVRVSPKEPNHKRKRIIEENLMDYIDVVDVSDRNKEIVRMYVAGAKYKEICEKYNIKKQTVSDIVLRYMRHAYAEKRK